MVVELISSGQPLRMDSRTLSSSTDNPDCSSIENSTGHLTPPSPPSINVGTGGVPNMVMVNGVLSKRSPSTLSLRNVKLVDEAAKATVSSFAKQEASLLADMVTQRLGHVAGQTGLEMDVLHSYFIAEFVSTFLDSLHANMTPSHEYCEMCCDIGQLLSAHCCAGNNQQQHISSRLDFHQRSNSVSFPRGGKASPPLSLIESGSPHNGSSTLLSPADKAPSVYSLNKYSSNSSGHHAVGSKLKHLFGNFVRRRTASWATREAQINSSGTETPGLSSPSFSISVDVIVEGILEVHTKSPIPASDVSTLSRSGLSNSKDLTSISHSELSEKEDEEGDDADSESPQQTGMSKSSEQLAVDSPWLLCHVRLIRSSAGPLLVLTYPPESNLPPSGVSLSAISEVRATTIGDALTTEDHAFILISSSMSRRLLLKTSSRSDMNRWLDALRPLVAYKPPVMVPLFPVNKFGFTVPSAPNTPNNHISQFGFSPGHQYDASSNSGLNNDKMTRSSSFMSRRRIQTSPAVDLQHLLKFNRSQKKEPPVSIASQPGSAQAASVDQLPMTSPPRSSSPGVSSVQQPSNCTHQRQRSLASFSWYWGNITRTEASDIVCKMGPSGTGCFLIRQSESQQGDYVVTFNCGGEAKHLRLKVYSDGRCQIQQYAQFSFPSLQALLDHFRTNALPIDFGGCNVTDSTTLTDGVKLTNYVSRRPKTPLSVKN